MANLLTNINNVLFQEITGKIKIDFKDSDTLRVLSQTLLQKDFGLDVIFPQNRLVPTIPLRLNYILWLEDLLSICVNDTCVDNKCPEVHGIDIGMVDLINLL